MKFILYLETTTWCINPLNIKIHNHETDLFTIGKTLSMTGGAVVNFLQARKPPLTPQEELTLANIEALAALKDPELDLPEEYQYTPRVAGCGSKDMHDWIAWCCPGLGVCTLTSSCSEEIFCE